MVQRSILGLLLGVSALAFPFVARAQEAAPESQSEEIVVTAQKRSEAIQTVPINISAFNAEALEAAGVTTPADLPRLAPTLKFATSIGTLASRFSIRGIGSFSNSAIEQSVATFIDGIYVPRPASIVNSMLDVQGVEVLSGPQGTLFGRNASVGALSFRTGTPTGDNSAELRGEISSGEHYRMEGIVNFPVSENVAVRLAGLADLFAGYWEDDLTGEDFGGIDTYQGRATVRTEFTPDLVWTLRGDYQSNEGDGLLNSQLVPSTLSPTTLAALTAAQGGIVPQLDLYSRHNNSFNGNAIVDDAMWGVSSDLTFDSSSGYTFRLLNGYWDWDSQQGDGDTASLSVYVLGRDLHYTSQSQSHELQIISPQDVLLGGRLDFVAGLYYFEEDLGITASSINGDSFCEVLVPIGALAGAFSGLTGATTADRIASCNALPERYSSVGDFDQNTQSFAAYGQATFALTDALDFTAGLRYTDEQKTGRYVGVSNNATGPLILTNETTDLSLEDSQLTWRANLAWRPTEDMMLFATASTGFKSGGFNNGIATRVLGQQRIFDAETVLNYEVGIKSEWMDGALTLNATAYQMDIENFQERSIIGLISTIRNVGEVRHRGVELQAIAHASDNARVNLGVAYLDSEILSYPNAPRPPFQGAVPNPNPIYPNGTQNLAGARLNYTPEWSVLLGGEIDGRFGDGGLTWRLNGDVTYTSEQKQGTTIDNGNLTVQDGYALLNGRFTVYGPGEQWSLSLFGRNLADEGYCASTVYQVLEGPLGLRWDGADADALNDTTAVRCNVGAPRVWGVSASVNF